MQQLLIFSALASVCSCAQVRLNETNLIGRDISPFNQEFFGGIPFSQPPMGELRLAPPIPLSLNVSTFDATEFGLACPQPASNYSENCLTINVLRPAGVTFGTQLPVLTWIYGGSFFEGDGSLYNGSAIVAQSMARGRPLLYVNFNYRLGPLGFPQGAEAEGKGSLNLALKDMRLALEWIQDNIAAFGGDPSKVTVWGASAGSISLSILMLDPTFSNVARATIFESGSASSALVFNATRRQIDWNNYVAAVPECANAETNDAFECLRNANITTLLSAEEAAYAQSQENFPFVPVIDGPGGLLPKLPSLLWADGTYAHIPFIAGTNKDEGTGFVPFTLNSSSQIFEWIIANNTPSAVSEPDLVSIANQLLVLYPNNPVLGSPFGTENDTFGLSPEFKRAAAIIGDTNFQSLRRAWIQTASEDGVKTFGYLFTDPQPNILPAYGVTHGTEVVYLYGENQQLTNEAAQILSHNMIDYWISFATSLDPNDQYGNMTRTLWTSYTTDNQAVIELNGDLTEMIQDNYRQEQIGYINQNGLAFNH